MLSHVYIKDLSKHVGEIVTLKGWLFNKRSSGKVKFLILREPLSISKSSQTALIPLFKIQKFDFLPFGFYLDFDYWNSEF